MQGVQNPIDEFSGMFAAKLLGDLDGFIYHHWRRSIRKEQLIGCYGQDASVQMGDAFQAPVVG